MDDIAVIRSCWADGLNHVGSVCQMNTGSILAGRPSLGAWATYGLGSANDNLPTFVVLTDAAEVVGGPKNWSSGFLPATYQGTQFRNDGTPIFHLAPPETISEQQQRSKLDLLTALNRRFSADKPEDSDLEARTQSYELAYRMQSAAPEAVDLSKESEATRSSMASTTRRRAVSAPTACWLAAWWSAAFVSSSSTAAAAAVGMRTPISKATTPRCAGFQTSRSPGCWQI